MGASSSNEAALGQRKVTARQARRAPKLSPSATRKGGYWSSRSRFRSRRSRFRSPNNNDCFGSSRDLIFRSEEDSCSLEKVENQRIPKVKIARKQCSEKQRLPRNKTCTFKAKKNQNLKAKLNGLNKEQLVKLIIQTTELNPSTEKVA